MHTILLLTISNIFMTLAWYGHLKYKDTPLWLAILASWGIAFVEYCFQVPANRIGHYDFTAAQLKTIQEVITLAVFCVFSVLYLREPLKLFGGSAGEAAKGFPANLNVAVALSLAGVGPDRTLVEIWADPTVTRNVHRIEVEADSARFSMSIENIPSENPKTGLITALSVIALLRKQRATLCVGT